MAWRILQGDCRDVLRTLPAESVQTCVTSPPYWGLRDYGVAGQLGLEQTPDEYVAELVEVFREVHRVLRPDGTLWLNLGDCYAVSGGGPQGATGQRARQRARREQPARGPRKRITASGLDGAGRNQAHALRADEAGRRSPGLKAKDLVGIPWRVAFALQADGWWLRADVIWAKPNPMPESVTDRPTKSHEYVFLLTKSERYFYDADAVREPCSYGDVSGAGADHQPPGGGAPHRGLRNRSGNKARKYRVDAGGVAEDLQRGHQGYAFPWEDNGQGRNRRSVWTITTKPFAGAHFAVMPCDLAEVCIRAGSRPGDMVLDPFAGAGTTGLVADRLCRSFIGVELSPAYADMARARIVGDAPLLNRQATGTEAA
jgi:DNA modification methylase